MEMIKVSLFPEQERETKMEKIGDVLGKFAEQVDFAALAAEIREAAPRSRRERAEVVHSFQRTWWCACWWCSSSATSATSRWSSSFWTDWTSSASWA